MGDAVKSQSRSPPSAFSAYSKSTPSPRQSIGFDGPASPTKDAPYTLPKRASSAYRQSSTQFAEKQQEEAYFADLLSYSLDRLGKEPELLAAEQDILKRQCQESAVQHYKGFIEVASCLASLKQEVTAMSHHLSILQDDFPALNDACETFSKEAKQHLAKRAQNKQLQKQQGVLTDILEVPSLMDICLRSGSYDDALDLRAFVAKIAVLQPNLPVVQSLVKETEAISQEMLLALLNKLRGSIQLPECLRVVAHLRRLAPFPEAKLRLIFLQCREEWLAEQVAALEEGNAYDYLKKLTDVHRLQLFDVVMQYRAIFADDTSSQEDAATSDGGALYSWAEHRVVFYLETLAEQLPRVREGGGLASVMEHCMYCGMSLGRVGLDFRALLPPIFEACILSLFTTSAQAAVETALMALESHKWVSLQSSAARRQKLLTPQNSSNLLGRTSSLSPSKPEGPPYELLEHPPLAVLTNGLLSALNELRHCAPLSLSNRLATALQKALLQFVTAMASYRETRSLSGEEGELLESACTALTGTLCPFIAECLSRIFPTSGQLLDIPSIAAVLEQAKPAEDEQMKDTSSNGAGDVQPDAESA